MFSPSEPYRTSSASARPFNWLKRSEKFRSSFAYAYATVEEIDASCWQLKNSTTPVYRG
jgi:hypothetical protein